MQKVFRIISEILCGWRFISWVWLWLLKYIIWNIIRFCVQRISIGGVITDNKIIWSLHFSHINYSIIIVLITIIIMTCFINIFDFLSQLIMLNLSQSSCNFLPAPFLTIIVPQPVIKHFHNTLLWGVLETSIQCLLLYSKSYTKLVPFLSDLIL